MPITPLQDIEDAPHTMLPNTLISPAACSAAAIVGTPPTAQRSAGDGSPAPESFAMALNQASSPPPAASPRPASTRDESRPDAAAADAATASDSATPHTDHTAAAHAATQRRTAAQAGTGVDEKSPATGLAIGLPPAEAEPGLLPAQTRDAPAGDRTGDAVDATPGATQLLAALVASTPAAADRSAGKASTQVAGAAGVATAASPARAGAAAAGDAPPAAPGATARRGDTGAEALTAATERDPASRQATAAAAAAAAPTAPAANTTWPAAATPLPTPATVLLATAPGAFAFTVAEARLQASPGSPEFAPALGAQLHVFLRDGIQHARLQLHPAELGPLTVQIQLNGATAQVRLAAEHPLTRQALEQAMPTLAGTLRESGLTLTGGGVFEQPAQPQPQAQREAQPQQDGRAPTGERSAGTRDGRDGRDTPAQAETAPLRAPAPRRGVVDLVA